jgi:hypothetical protein
MVLELPVKELDDFKDVIDLPKNLVKGGTHVANIANGHIIDTINDPVRSTQKIITGNDPKPYMHSEVNEYLSTNGNYKVGTMTNQINAQKQENLNPDKQLAIMNFQSSVQHAYYQDTGRNANEDWQYLPNVPGDMIQAVPDSVYSGTGLAISGIAVATGATILSPVGLAGLGVTALSTSKTILNHNEGKISNKDAIINITSDFGTMALPGKTGLAVESGIFINDLVRDINKRNNDNN